MNNNDTELNAELIRKAGKRILEICKADESFLDTIIDKKLSELCGKPIIDTITLLCICVYYGMREGESIDDFLARRIENECELNELRRSLYRWNEKRN